MAIAGGSDTQVQFNNSGNLDGSADLTWNGSKLSVKELNLPSSVTTGARKLATFGTNEAGKADFGLALGQFAGSNGETRRDNILTYGYNAGLGGAKQVNNDHLFTFTIENNYKTSELIRQLEFYFTYENAASTYYTRPFAITPHLDTNYIEIGIRGDNNVFGSPDNTNDFLTIAGDNGADGGTIALTGADSQITYVGTQRHLITHTGRELLGVQSSVAEFASNFETARISGLNNTVTSTITLQFGGTNSRGIRWNNTNNRFETQIASLIWEPIMSAGSITSPTIGGDANNYSVGDTTSRIMRWAASAAYNVTGVLPILTPWDGQEHVVINVGSYPITICHQNTGSTAANRFLCASGGNERLMPNQAGLMIYDTAVSRWRFFKLTQGGPEVLKV